MFKDISRKSPLSKRLPEVGLISELSCPEFSGLGRNILTKEMEFSEGWWRARTCWSELSSNTWSSRWAQRAQTDSPERSLSRQPLSSGWRFWNGRMKIQEFRGSSWIQSGIIDHEGLARAAFIFSTDIFDNPSHRAGKPRSQQLRLVWKTCLKCKRRTDHCCCEQQKSSSCHHTCQDLNASSASAQPSAPPSLPLLHSFLSLLQTGLLHVAVSQDNTLQTPY